MRIGSKSGLSRLNASTKLRTPKRGSGNFHQRVSSPDSIVGTVSTVAGSEPLSGIDGLLAVQQVEKISQNADIDWARHWGGDILSRLSLLRDGLLNGNIPAERLELLTDALKLRRIVTDPELNSIVDQIELRARIEIAKLERNSR